MTLRSKAVAKALPSIRVGNASEIEADVSEFIELVGCRLRISVLAGVGEFVVRYRDYFFRKSLTHQTIYRFE